MIQDSTIENPLTAPEILRSRPLFVFALESEAAGAFGEVDTLITGIGKVNAAYRLAHALRTVRPGMIVNLGSAGSPLFARDSVVCCTRFVQRDMDVTGLGFSRFETPLSGLGPVLAYGRSLDGLPVGVCGTGDSFEMAHREEEYNVIDMEAYALALVAREERIPFVCLKYISDGADGKAAGDWTEAVHRAAFRFRTLLGLP